MGALTDLEATTAQIGAADYVVTAHGEFDIRSAPWLDAVVDGFSEPGTIVLDLRGVQFLDVVGIEAISAAADRTRTRGGQLVLVSASRHLLAVLRRTGRDRSLTICPTLTAALDTLGARPA